jgi:hypothetical protein
MIISTDGSRKSSEWIESDVFHAFDIPLQGMARFVVKSSVPSILNSSSSIESPQRHRVTTSLFERDWDFRFNFFAFPAEKQDCTFRHDEGVHVSTEEGEY